MLRLGVDVGGTKTELVVLEEDGRERLRRRGPTPAGDYAAALQALAGSIELMQRDAGAPCSVGIGVPGRVAAGGILRNAHNTPYNDRPFGRDLGALLGCAPRIANDANCFALSEATDGAARGAGLVFGAVLGTGAGGGIVASGRLLVGHDAVGSEWGHNPLPWPEPDEVPGPPCYCGRIGCIEQWVSGPALARDHAARAAGPSDPEQIASAAARGDPACAATLDRHQQRLARALAHVVNLLAPDVIVLGGGLSGIERLYRGLPAAIARWTYARDGEVAVVPAAHGAASGVRGAALIGR